MRDIDKLILIGRFFHSKHYHFPVKWQVRIKWSFSIIVQNCLLKCTSKWIKLLESHLMAVLASKLELQGFLGKNFHSQRTCVANASNTNTTIDKGSERYIYYVSHCTSKYAKENEEKEKNTTIFAKYHRELLKTVRDYLFNMLTY